MSRLNTMYPNDEFLKDISNVIGKVDSKNETQIKKEIEQVGYKEFYRYYKEKDIYIKQLQQENQELKKQLEEYDRKLFITKNELDMRQKSIDNKLNQQKEFIEMLEKEILDSKAGSSQQYYFQEILSNYKEIIGNDINVGSKGGKE